MLHTPSTVSLFNFNNATFKHHILETFYPTGTEQQNDCDIEMQELCSDEIHDYNSTNKHIIQEQTFIQGGGDGEGGGDLGVGDTVLKDGAPHRVVTLRAKAPMLFPNNELAGIHRPTSNNTCALYNVHTPTMKGMIDYDFIRLLQYVE